MFKQIKYAVFDIKLSKRTSIIFFLQMVVIFMLFNFSIRDIIRVNNGLNRLEKLEDNKAYVNRDSTSNEKIDALIADSQNTIPKMKELYNFIISNNKIDKYSKWEFTTTQSVEGHPIVEATANKMFFDIFDIKVYKGRMFNESDFADNMKTIPIVVGYNLKDRYKLGTIYSEVDPVTNSKVTYQVIGIIEHNSSYPSLVDIGRELDLNYTFLRPLNITSLNDFASLDMAISSTVVFANDEKEVNSIEEKSVDLGLFSMDYRPIQEREDEFLRYFKKKIIYQFFIAFIILLFAAVSMASSLATIISKKMKEFSIHLICGGTIHSILQRLLWQLIIMLSLALVPILIFDGVNISLLYTIIFGCIVALLIMIIPYAKIRTISIIQLARRSE